MEAMQILWELKDLNHFMVKVACVAITARNHDAQKKPARTFMESLSH